MTAYPRVRLALTRRQALAARTALAQAMVNDQEVEAGLQPVHNRIAEALINLDAPPREHPEFRITFGPIHVRPAIDPDGWWTIVAPDYGAAQHLAHQLLGAAFSNIHGPEDPGPDWGTYFPAGERLRLIHPDCL